MAEAREADLTQITVGRKSRKGRMFGFPWSETRKKAFYALAEQLREDNASSLARKILEAYMLSVLGAAKSRELGILGEHEEWEPASGLSILEYAINKHGEHRHNQGNRTSMARSVSDEMRREDAINNSGKRHKKNLTKVS